MAQVPYNDGVPEVAPRTSVPDDYQHIQANPDQFGGLIAKGEQQLGAGTENAVKFFGKVQTDDATNNAMTRMDNAVNKFKNLQGADRLNAQADTEQEIEAAYQEGRKGLTTPEQQLDYDNQTRNFRLRYVQGQMSTLGADAAKTFATNTNINGKNLHLGLIAANPHDDQVFADNLTNAAVYARQQAHIEGLGPEAETQAATQAVAEGWSARIRSIAVKDPAAAYDMAQKQQKDLSVVDNRTGTTYYDALSRELETRKDQQLGNEVKQRAISGATGAGGVHPPQHDQPVAGVPVSYLSAIQNEEGFDPQPKWDVHQWTVGYGTKAAGPDERPSKAELDQRFNTEITKAAVIVDKVNPNLDPGTRAALTSLTYRTGEAWTQSGLGNAVRSNNLPMAQQLFLQYNKVAGAYNKGAASRVTNEANWFGSPDAPQSQAAPQYANLKSSAYQFAMNDPVIKDNPRALQYALQGINQDYQTAQIASDTTARQQKEANDQGANEYISRILKGDTKGIVDQIADDPRLDHTTRLALGHAATTDTELGVYAKNFQGAYKGVMAPVGDPARINTVAELYQRAGTDGDLSIAGAQKLAGIMAATRGGDEKAARSLATHKTMDSFLSDAADQMIHDKDIGTFKQPDVKGTHLYKTVFVPKFMQEATQLAAKADETGDFDKLNKYLSRDNVDKMINDIYPLAQRNQDRITADANAGEGRQLPTPPPLPGVKPENWQALMKTPPVAADGKSVSPFYWGGALQMLREGAGDPKVVQAFDDYWGPRGFPVKDVLDKLGPASSNPQAQEGAPPAPAAGAPAAPAAPPVPAHAPLVPPRQPLPPGVAEQAAERAQAGEAASAERAAETARGLEQRNKVMQKVREGHP